MATVSRALSRPDLVTEDTRARVQEAARAVAYTPNAAARNLRARRSMMALVVVPDIGNPFFSEILRGIDEGLSEAGYGLIIGNLDNAARADARFVDLAHSGQVDGVILLCGRVLRGEQRTIEDAGPPIVAACEIVPGATFPQIEIDNEAAAREATGHLTSLGHRRIAYLSGPPSNILDHRRRAGFLAALAAAGLARDDALELTGDFTFSAGAAAARDILALPAHRRPTALFAANDEMAIGFLKEITRGGLRVPSDFSIVGFDGIEYADHSVPMLTTVRQPRRAIGQQAAGRLLDLMNGRAGRAPGHTVLPARLEMRESSGPAPAATAGRATPGLRRS